MEIMLAGNFLVFSNMSVLGKLAVYVKGMRCLLRNYIIQTVAVLNFYII